MHPGTAAVKMGGLVRAPPAASIGRVDRIFRSPSGVACLLVVGGTVTFPVVGDVTGCAATGRAGVAGVQVEVSVRPDRARYAAGEPIAVTLTARNPGPADVVLEFMTSQRYDMLVLDAAGDTVWHWSAGKAFLQVLGEEALAPGAELAYQARYEGRLPAGEYTVVGRLVTARPLEARATVTVG